MRILVYGDSNSWGTLADGLGHRHPDRWPVVMARELGAEVIEDCVPGRTSVHDDPEMTDATGAPPDTFNGASHLCTSLLGAAPVDLLLIKLGTNDFKARFDPSAGRIAGNLAALVGKARMVQAGPGPWAEGQTPAIGVISPAPIGPLAEDPEWERCAEWRGGRAASLALKGALDAAMAPLTVPVFDAGVAEPSKRDPIHFEPDQHPKLGRAVAKWVRDTFGAPG